MAPNLEVPSNHDSNTNKACRISPVGGMRQNPKPSTAGPALWPRTSCPNFAPHNTCFDLAPMTREPSMAEDYVIASNVASTELQAQVIVSLIGLGCQYETDTGHIKTMQEPILESADLSVPQEP